MPWLAACAAPRPAPDRLVSRVLRAHGFAPPTRVRASDGTLRYLSDRAGENNRSVQRILVRLDGSGRPRGAEIIVYRRGPTDWAVLGTLFTASPRREAAEIRRELEPGRARRLPQ